MPVEVTCAECGKTMMRPPSHAARVTTHYCSYRCNGKARGREWALHGHKGHEGWKDPTRASARAKMTGSLNPAWKGGVTKRERKPTGAVRARKSEGVFKRAKGNYPAIRYVRCPVELLPMSRKDGYIMEHRLTMAWWVGRPLTRSECVHHLDHNPLNNALTNLELWPTNSDHKRAEGGRFVEGVANRWCPPDLGLL
jgi:hypothetical protein